MLLLLLLGSSTFDLIEHVKKDRNLKLKKLNFFQLCSAVSSNKNTRSDESIRKRSGKTGNSGNTETSGKTENSVNFIEGCVPYQLVFEPKKDRIGEQIQVFWNSILLFVSLVVSTVEINFWNLSRLSLLSRQYNFFSQSRFLKSRLFNWDSAVWRFSSRLSRKIETFGIFKICRSFSRFIEISQNFLRYFRLNNVDKMRNLDWEKW